MVWKRIATMIATVRPTAYGNPKISPLMRPPATLLPANAMPTPERPMATSRV